MTEAATTVNNRGSLRTNGDVPHYAANLTRAHRLHRRELRRIVADLPIPRGGSVLDLGSGDGAWLRWLSARVGADGMATGIDHSQSHWHGKCSGSSDRSSRGDAAHSS